MGGTEGHRREPRTLRLHQPEAPKQYATHLSMVLDVSEDGHQETTAARTITGLEGSPSPMSLLCVGCRSEALGIALMGSYHILPLRMQMERRPYPLPSAPVIPVYLKSCTEGPKNSLVCDRNPIMGHQIPCQLSLYKIKELIKTALCLIHRDL